MLRAGRGCSRSGRLPKWKALLVLCVLFPSSVYFGQAASPSKLQSLYESHQWFALRDATAHATAPLFYRAAVEAAFNRVKPAQEHLTAVIQAAPRSREAYQAHELLAYLYFRNGLYGKASTQIDALLTEKPDSEDAKNMRPLFSALSQSDQSVFSRKPSSIQMRMEDGNLYLPLLVEGKEANYVFDTGANFSIMSESEAERLGLVTRDVNTQIGDSSGSHVSIRVAVARDLILGNLHLKNVAFGVLPDKREPFVELPEGKRGILGIPVLLAMQTLRWEPKGAFAFSFTAQHKNDSTSNLSFDGSNPVTQVAFQKKALNFTLDTGAIDTDLNPPFAKEFSDLLKASGQKESHKLTGVGGSSSNDSILLPSVTLLVGGQEVSLKPAHVLVTQGVGTWAAGNLGMDLLNQARAITLDFQAMTLTLE